MPTRLLIFGSSHSEHLPDDERNLTTVDSSIPVILLDAAQRRKLCMANVLQKYFPMIRTREEVLDEITENNGLMQIYQKWTEEQKKLFLDYCSGQ